MATFLVTTKMNPALRARVERAVTGGRSTSPKTMRRIISLARFAIVLTVAFGIRSVIVNRRRDSQEFDRLRTETAQRARESAAALAPKDLAGVERAQTWIARVASADFVEVVADELRAPGALKAKLGGPLVWVRGPIDGFTPTKLAETAQLSGKDSLLYCLFDPPAARTEKVVLEKVRVARLGGPALDESTSNVRRLHDAVVGLPYLSPAWSDRARAAVDRNEVLRLRREWEHAPIGLAVAAAQARLLLVALDEPGDGPGPTELDGERAHFVRVALIDLEGSKILLGTRVHVDPSWVSEARRPTLAMALDSCALAFDIHEAIRKMK